MTRALPRETSGGLGFHQIVDTDRQAPDAFAGRVEDRALYRRGSADIAEFADAFDTRRVHLFVDLRNQDHLDLANVSVDRHMIFGDVAVDVARGARIDLGLLV